MKEIVADLYRWGVKQADKADAAIARIMKTENRQSLTRDVAALGVMTGGLAMMNVGVYVAVLGGIVTASLLTAGAMSFPAAVVLCGMTSAGAMGAVVGTGITIGGAKNNTAVNEGSRALARLTRKVLGIKSFEDEMPKVKVYAQRPYRTAALDQKTSATAFKSSAEPGAKNQKKDTAINPPSPSDPKV